MLSKVELLMTFYRIKSERRDKENEYIPSLMLVEVLQNSLTGMTLFLIEILYNQLYNILIRGITLVIDYIAKKKTVFIYAMSSTTILADWATFYRYCINKFSGMLLSLFPSATNFISLQKNTYLLE